MSLKKLGIALLAVFMLGAVMANSAFAENEFSETGASFTQNLNPEFLKSCLWATQTTSPCREGRPS